MKCKHRHDRMIVLHGFSEGPCKVCGETIVTSHTPCDEVCESCSEKTNLCTICGEEIGIFTPEYMDYAKINGFEFSEDEFWDKMHNDYKFAKQMREDNPSYPNTWIRIPNYKKSFIVPKEVAYYIKQLQKV